MASNRKTKQLWTGVLVALLISQSVVLAFAVVRLGTLNNRLDTLYTKLNDLEFQSAMLSNDIYSIRTTQKPVVLPIEDRVAFPELRITLPRNDITKTLEYYFNKGEPGDSGMRVTSTLIDPARQPKESSLSCAELVRIHREDIEPYSPWEEKAGSVLLADGRTLYIMASKAFANNEATTEPCTNTMWDELTPQQVADEFKKAQSY